MPEPVLFLDVDGVLNPHGTETCPPGYVEHDLFPEDDEPVRVCAAHGALIRRLATVYEVVWATAWNDRANTLLAPLLGIDPLPVARMPDPPFEPSGKVPPIAAYAGSRPAVWIDDLDIPEAHEWARRAFPTLLIPADPAIGLTEDLVRQALAWPPAAGTPATWFAARRPVNR